MTTDKKWYPNKVGNQWFIQSGTKQNDPDVLADIWVGKEQAERNAKLCAAAPEMRQLLENMKRWVESYINTPGQHNRHGARYVLEQYKELEKQLQ